MSLAAAAPRVFSIAAGNRFLEVLARELLEGRIVPGLSRARGPLALAAATIYVPTRRAAEALTQCFASLAEGATLLPRILPLGALEPVEDSLLMADAFAGLGDTPPPAMPPVERRLGLALLLAAWNAKLKTALSAAAGGEPLAVAASARGALMLADELGRLIDEFNIEGVSWERIAALAPGHDRYWDWTRDLLAIAGAHWPAHLAEHGVIDGSARQNLLIRAEAARLAALAPREPFIVAGSTGSRPATAELMRVIAKLPEGAIVLPGLDTHLDDAGWNAIGFAAADEPLPAHPQEGMKRLIAHLGAGRRDVIEIDAVSGPLALRRSAVSEIMRPAATTDLWRAAGASFSAEGLAAAWRDVSLIEAKTEREEALAIALALREALETAGRTAALITPDRALAARVQAELKRWNIAAADSAGRPLAMTEAGLLALNIAAAAQENFSAASLSALLAHRGLTLGGTRGRAAEHARIIGIACLRGKKLAPGAEGLRQALADAPERIADRRAPPYRRRIAPQALEEAGAFLLRLLRALEPLRAAIAADRAKLSETIPALLAAYTEIAAPPPGAERRAFNGEAAFADLAEAAAAAADSAGFTARADEFAGAVEALMSGIAVPDFHPGHPRLHILGLLESRLLHADLVIAAGLSEGVWPPAAETGPFLNRLMRKELGLDPPERRIGQTALDFSQALGAPEVIIARAARSGGEPATPSRFLRRMEAFLGGALITDMRARGSRWLALAAALDAPDEQPQAERPAPRPPLEARPKALSLSELPKLYRDPYAIYARHVLNLAPFEALDPAYGAGDRGEWIHAAVAEALRQDHGADAGRWLGAFLDAGRRAFAPGVDDPAVAAFWLPRFEAAAAWLANAEAERRPEIIRCLAEQSGRLKIPLEDGSDFELSARLDRADIRHDGGFDVFDYKSGGVPSLDEVKRGFAPQLTLEAHMIAQGAFKEIAGGMKPGRLAYIRVTGGEEACEEEQVKPPKKKTGEEGEARTLEDMIAEDVTRLKTILGRFRKEPRGYASRLAQPPDRRGDYDHLARAGEWPLQDIAGEDGA